MKKKSLVETAQEAVNNLPESLRCNVSDGYHKFYELYEHRIELFISLCKRIQYDNPAAVWRSEVHSDGSKIDKWFILGIGKRKGVQITYHLPITKWKDTEFAITLKKAPKFDGHTSDDVLKRLKTLG